MTSELDQLIEELKKEKEELWKEFKAERKRSEALVDAVEKFEQKFRSFSMKQHKLLVVGQNLKSASENWNKFPEAFSFDLEPLFKALAAYRKEKPL